MSLARRPCVLLLTFLGLSCLTSFASEAVKRPRRLKKPAPVEEPAPAQASPVVLPPATLEQMPARPPVVTVENGELSIVAQNSSLADILQAVSSRTGASIDMPEGADERVVVKLGPGPIRDVLDALLGGSKLNYVMLGSESDPTALTQILLFSKPGVEDKKSAALSAQTSVVPPGRRGPTQRQPVAQQPDSDSTPAAGSGDDWEYNAPAAADARTAAEETAPAPAPAAQPAAQAETAKTAENPQQPQVTFPTPATSPEEQPRTPNIKSMQEILQDMYQQRQKMIQQQNQQQPQQ